MSDRPTTTMNDHAASDGGSEPNGGLGGLLRHWRGDLPASVVVFLVALPLCLGIAVASGAPPASGLISGIIGGLLVGALAGAPLQVSGPAAGLAVIVFELLQKHDLGVLGLIVIQAGILQIAAGWAGVGQWFRAVSPAVIKGMLAGIGVLIFASQFHVMVDDTPPGGGLANLVTIPVALYKAAVPPDAATATTHQQAALVGLVTIIVLVAWRFIARGFLKTLPAPLVAVVLATLIAWQFELPIKRIEVPGNLLDAVHVPSLSGFTELSWGAMAVAVITVALVASAETLLCATAVDQLHNGPRTRYDRELFAQGVGNITAGAVGGLPITGVIVRSSANVESGARTRLSAVLHGVWLLLFVAALPVVLTLVPIASLAAILVYTGYKLADVATLRDLWRVSRTEAAIFLVTVAVIVATDLLAGVLAGVGLSLAKLVWQMTHVDVDLHDDPATNRATLRLGGAATFVRLPKLAAALERVQPSRELHVKFDKLDYIDHACLDLLMNWEQQHAATGGQLVIDWADLQGRFQSQPASRRPSKLAS